MKKLLVCLPALLVFALACSPKTGSKSGQSNDPQPLTNLPEINLPNLEIVADGADSMPEISNDRPVYQAAADRDFDLIHEKVELSFDWPKARANGRATLTLRPYFYETDRLTLDAKNFEIKKVAFEGKNEPLKFSYDGLELVVELGRKFSRKEEFKLVVEYVARPEERTSIGGSAAISQDKGLYFINFDGKDAEKPMQIWTQGETESNSFWMPTIDKPNERCTGELVLTVENRFKTLSNGLLFSSVKNADGSRTDHWKMDKPHAPYLFMMAIGEYAVVREKWRDIELSYWVEPKFEADATAIFPNTAEMMEYFSTILDYPYPWQKYAQVIVRDYVSGAMENTTATIFSEALQQHRRDLLDENEFELTVAHELFHHWFGDLVTCESWSNLTLNEGFANYSEYLWTAHKYGRTAADRHLRDEMDGYFGSAQDGGHDLIDFKFSDREAMFDAHSYNKGGSVLHMLRKTVGDEAFFGALNSYLKAHQFTAVEADELRMAFEDMTGQDLNWFWNQWFFDNGHPQITASWDYDATTKMAALHLEQIQDPTASQPIFRLPMTVDVWLADGSKTRHEITFDHRKQSFEFAAATQPLAVDADAERVLLTEWTFDRTESEHAFLFQNSTAFATRELALQNLYESELPAASLAWKAALTDDFHLFRQLGISHADPKDPETVKIVAKIAENDPNPGARAEALTALAETGDRAFLPIFQKNLSAENAYSVVGAALSGLVKLDAAAAAEAAKSLEKEEHPAIQSTLMEIYAATGDRSKLPFFQSQLEKVDGPAAFSFFDNYTLLLKKVADADLQKAFFEKCYAFGLDENQSQWRRFGATKALADRRNELKEAGQTAPADALTKQIDDIKAKETDQMLLLYYNMF